MTAARDPLAPRWELHGYAVVSDDDMIADADGRRPNGPGGDAALAYVMDQIDRADLVMLGRNLHETVSNPRRRRRLVVSRRPRALEQRPDAWWWNPDTTPIDSALDRLLPSGGRVAVAGGQAVFHHILSDVGFDAFHLARVLGVAMPGGRSLFGGIAGGAVAESVLAGAGMRAGSTVTIDPRGPVELTVWRKGY